MKLSDMSTDKRVLIQQNYNDEQNHKLSSSFQRLTNNNNNNNNNTFILYSAFQVLKDALQVKYKNNTHVK